MAEESLGENRVQQRAGRRGWFWRHSQVRGPAGAGRAVRCTAGAASPSQALPALPTRTRSQGAPAPSVSQMCQGCARQPLGAARVAGDTHWVLRACPLPTHPLSQQLLPGASVLPPARLRPHPSSARPLRSPVPGCPCFSLPEAVPHHPSDPLGDNGPHLCLFYRQCTPACSPDTCLWPIPGQFGSLGLLAERSPAGFSEAPKAPGRHVRPGDGPRGCCFKPQCLFCSRLAFEGSGGGGTAPVGRTGPSGRLKKCSLVVVGGSYSNVPHNPKTRNATFLVAGVLDTHSNRNLIYMRTYLVLNDLFFILNAAFLRRLSQSLR